MKTGISKRAIPQKSKALVPKLDLSHSEIPKSSKPNSDRYMSTSKLISPTNITSTSRPSALVSPTNFSFLFTDENFESRIETQTRSQESLRLRSLEHTLERNKRSYENQTSYMQEYINFLKQKLGSEAKEEFLEVKQLQDLTENLKDEIKYLNTIISKSEEETKNYLEELCEKQSQIEKFNKKFANENRKPKHSLSTESTLSLEKEMKLLYESQINELKNLCNDLRIEVLNKEQNIEFLQVEGKRQEKMIIQKSVLGIQKKVKEKVESFMKGQNEEFQNLVLILEDIDSRIDQLAQKFKIVENNKEEGDKEIIFHLERALEETYLDFDKVKISFEQVKKENNLLSKRIEEINESYKGSLVANEKLQGALDEGNEKINELKQIHIKLDTEKTNLMEEMKEMEKILEGKVLEVEKEKIKSEFFKSAFNHKSFDCDKKEEVIKELLEQIQEFTKFKEFQSEVRSEEVQKVCEKCVEVEKNDGVMLDYIEKIDKLNRIIFEQSVEIKKNGEVIQKFSNDLENIERHRSELEQDSAIKTSSISKLADELSHLQLVHSNLLLTSNETQSQLSSATLKASSLLSELQEKDETIQELESTILSQTESIQKLISSHKQNLDHIQSGDEIKRSNDNKIQSQAETLTLLEARIKSLEKDLNYSDLSIENLNSIIKSSTANYDSIINDQKEEISILASSLQKQKNLKAQEKEFFDSALEDKEETCRRLLIELEKEKSSNGSLFFECKNLKLKQAEIESNHSKLVLCLNETINSYKSNEQKLTKKVQDFEFKEKEFKGKLIAVDLEIEKITEENRYLRERIEDLEASRSDSLDKHSQNTGDFELKIREIEGKHKLSLSSLKAELEALAETLKTETNSKQVLETQLKIHEENLVELEEELKDLNLILTSKDLEIHSLKLDLSQQISELKSKLKEKDLELKSNQEIQFDLSRNLDSTRSLLLSEKQLTQEFQSNFTSQEKNLTKLKSDLNSAQSLIQTLNDKLIQSTQALSAKDSIIETLEQSLNSVQNLVQELQYEKAKEKLSLQEKLQVASLGLQRTSAELAEVKNHSEKQNVSIQELKFKAMDNENTLKSQISSLAEQLRHLEEKEKIAKREKTRLEKANKELNDKIQEFDEKIQRFGKDNKELRDKEWENESMHSLALAKLEMIVQELEEENKEIKTRSAQAHDVISLELMKLKQALEVNVIEKNKFAKENSELQKKLHEMKSGNEKILADLNASEAKTKEIEKFYQDRGDKIQKIVKDKEKQAFELAEENKSLGLLNKQLLESKKNHETYIKGLDKVITDMKLQMNENAVSVESVREELRKSQFLVADLMNNLEVKDLRIEELQNGKRTIEEKIDLIKRQNGETCDKYAAEILSLRSVMGEKDNENLDLKSQIECLKYELKLLNISNTENQNTQSLKTSEVFEENKELRSAILQLKKEILNHQNDSHKAKLAFEKVSETCMKLQHDNTSLSHKLNELHLIIKKSQEAHNQELLSKETRLKSLQNSDDSLKTQLKSFETQAKLNLDYQLQKEISYKSQISSLQHETEVLKHQLSIKSKEVETLAESQNIIESANLELNKIRDNQAHQIKQKDTNLEEMNSEIMKLKHKLSLSEVNEESFKSQNEELTEEIDRKNQDLLAYGVDVEKLQVGLKELQEKMQKSQVEFKIRLEGAEKETERYQKQTQELEKLLKKLENELIDLKNAKRLVEEVSKRENFELKTSFESLKADYEVLRSQIVDYEQEKLFLVIKLDQATKDSSLFLNESNQLKRKIEDLILEKTQEKHEFELLSLELNQEVKRIEGINKDLIENNKSAANLADKEKKNLINQINEMKTTLENTIKENQEIKDSLKLKLAESSRLINEHEAWKINEKSILFKLEQHDDEIKDFQTIISTFKEQEEKALLEKNELLKKIAGLESLLKENKDSYENLYSESASDLLVVKSLKSEINKKSSQLEESEVMYKEINSKLQNCQNNLDLQYKINEKMKDQESKLMKNIHGMEKNIISLEQTISSLNIENKSLEVVNGELIDKIKEQEELVRTMHDEKELNQFEVQDLKGKISSLNEKAETLKTKLKKQQEKTKKFQESSLSLELNLKDKIRFCSELERKLSEIRKESEDKELKYRKTEEEARLHQKNFTQNKSVADQLLLSSNEKDFQIESLKAQIGKLLNKRIKSKALKKDSECLIDQLKSSINSLADEKSVVQIDLKTAYESLTEFSRKFDELNLIYDQLKADYSKSLENLELSQNSSNSIIQSLKLENLKLDEICNKNKSELKELSKLSENLEIELKSTKSLLNKHEDTIRSLHNEMNIKESELESAGISNHSLQEELNQSKQTIQKLQQLLDSDRKKLKDSIESSFTHSESLEACVKDLKIKISQIEINNSHDLDLKNKEIEKTQKELDLVTKKLNESLLVIEANNEDLKAKDLKIQEKTKEINERKQEIFEIENKLSG